MSNSDNKGKEKRSIDPDQIRDIYFEYDVPLKSIVARRFRLPIIIVAFIFLLTISVSAILKIPQEVTLPFELKGGGLESIYQFDEPIKITQSFVKMNDSVRVGDPLIKIESPEIFSLLSKLKSAEESKSAYDDFTVPKLIKEIEMKKIEVDNAKSTLELIKAQKLDFQFKQKELLTELKKAINLAEKKLKRNKELLSSRTISQQQFEEINQELVSTKSDYNTKKLEFDLRIRDIEILMLDYSQKISQLTTQLELLKLSEKEESQQSNVDLQRALDILNFKYGNPTILNDGIILNSKIKGRVSFLTSDEKATTNNQILLRIEGGNSSKKAFATLGDSDLAIVKKGLSASLKFHNFPYFQFGTLDGVTSNISTAGNNGQFLIEIQISKESNSDLSERVLEGMKGNATILTDEKTVLEYVFHGIIKPFYSLTE